MSLLELVQLPSPSNSNCGNQPDGYELSAIANTGVMVEDHAGTSEDEAMDFTGFHLTRHEIAALDAPTSLFILSGDNILRLRMLQVIRSRIFQNIVLGCIILNSLLLGADWPSYINPPAFATFLQVADLFFTAVFTLEIVVKVIALGFILHDGSFMRVGWNVMDLVIVAFSLVQLILGNRALSGVRAVRVFRPLRSISRIPRLKQLVGGLIKGLPQVLDNLILFVFVIVLFAMAGVQLFMDSLSMRCYVNAFVNSSSYAAVFPTPFLIQNESTTCGGTYSCKLLSTDIVASQSCSVNRPVYTKADMNYDSFFSACMLVLKIIVNDNWPDDLDALTNSSGYVAVVFFVLAVSIGTWYCINLFLAILTSAYSSKEDEEEDELLTKRDRGVQADSCQQEVLLREIDRIEQNVTDAGAFASHFGTFDFHPEAVTEFRNQLLVGAIELSHAKRTKGGALRFGGHQGFSYLDVFHDDSRVCEALQEVVERPITPDTDSDDETDEAHIASSKLDDERAQWRKNLSVFVSHPLWDGLIMLVTVVNVGALSIDYYGISDYLSMILNVTSLVCTGMFGLDILLKMVAFGPLTYLKLGMNRLDLALVIVSIPDIIASGGESSAFSAIRVFRLFRLIRLLRSIKAMQTLLLCVIHSLTSAALLSMLLLLFLYIYSILGMQLFGLAYNNPQTNVNVRDSFGTLWEAALGCFIVVTGDNWTDRIFLNNPTSVADTLQNVLFFVSLFVIGNYVFLNLFVAILLDSLSEMMEKVEQTELVMPNLVLPTISNAHRLLGLPSASPLVVKQTDSEYELQENDDKELLHRAQSRKGFHDQLVEEDGMLLHVVKALGQHFFGDRGVVVAGNALFIFPADSVFRKFMVRAVSCNAFQTVIDIVLVINVVAIAMQSPLLDTVTASRLDNLNNFLTWFFVAEMSVKVIAFGVWWPEGELKKHMVTTDGCEWKVYPAYLRIGWNVVDFIVVVASVLAQVFSQAKILRAFRTIRLIHRIPPMRTVVLSLIQAVPQVLNAFGLVIFLFVVFTIMGVQFFKGKFYQCNDPSVQMMANCTGYFDYTVQGAFDSYNMTMARSWNQLDYHFDNFGASMTSVFVISVGDGWSNIMYNAMDTTTVGGGLSYYNAPQYALFFVIMYACCNFCALQMLVGVLINYFQKMKELNDGSAVLTPQQRMYVHARHAIEASAIVEDEETPMPNGLSQLIHNIVTFRTQYSLLGIWKLEQPIWEYFSFLVVMTNTVAIAYTHSDMTDEENTILNNINLASLCIFTAEVVLLIIAYFPMQYFSLGWNVMDFLIVCAGWVEVGLPAAPGLTFLRVIRVSKLLRGTGVEKLILTTVRSYQSFLNALLMLILVLFIYASVGVQLFGDIPFNNILDINYNFRTLPNAMLILFQIITTEGWETTMLGCNSVGTYASYPYFISFMVLGSFVILQLFTAVVVDVFEQQTDESDRIVTEFLEIREQWLCTFGPVKAIPMQDFIQFLTKIPQDLTELSKNPQRVDIVHLLASLAIPVTSQGLVYYHHAVNALAWRRFNIEVRTIGGVIHGIVFDKVVHQSFTIGEAFCAEILQSKWRDYKMKQKLGDREYTNLVNRTRSSSVFLMPRQRSVCNIVRKDEARRMSTLSTNDDDEGYDHKMLESVDFSSGGDSAVPGRGRN